MKYLALLVGVCGVASAALLARFGLDAGFSPIALSAWRLAIASAGLIIFQMAKPKLATTRQALATTDRIKTIVAGIFLAVHFATWIASLEYTSVARSTLFVATSPVWAGFAGLFVPRLKPRPSFWLGLAVAAAGTLLITSVAAPAKGSTLIGDSLAVVGAICIVPYLLLSQEVQESAGTLRTITWIYASAAAWLVVPLAISGHFVAPSTPQVWISLLGMALFAQVVGHGLFNYSLRHFTASQVAAATLLEPVFASALAWPILGEKVGFAQALGGLLLLAGVSLTLRAG